MAQEKLKGLLDSLHSIPTSAEQEKVLCEIATTWKPLGNEDVSTLLKDNILFEVLAQVLEANTEAWGYRAPTWIGDLLFCTYLYDNLFQHEHKTVLCNIFQKFIFEEHWGFTIAFGMFVCLPSVKQSLLFNDELFNKLKQAAPKVIDTGNVFWNFVDGSEEWQQKILSDSQLILDLLNNKLSWEGIFENVAQHPDAKTLLPPDVLRKACNGRSNRCIKIRALLSSDDDISKFELSATWIKETKTTLENLVHTGVNKIKANLLDLVLPLANLSVVETCKELLGKEVLVPLLKIVTEKLPEGRLIQPFLKRGKQEASRAIWNFAYHQANCKLIRDAGGFDKLCAILVQTDDEIVKRNVEGILYMLAPHVEHHSVKGHVMISYNWGNQPIVLRLAKSLKEHGYNIWLDIERMGGSTLEAMADAIEQADLVLICMSQKYKDSPNCRLEGEYCVNRRMKFIPLMMQKGYRPDGWLGLALGAKLYYEFTDENDWDTKISELVKAIGNSGKSSALSAPVPPTTVPVYGNQSTRKIITEWTSDDICEWMKGENIAQHFTVFQKNRVNGKALLELKRLCTSHPKVFVAMCEKMEITLCGDILELSTCLQKLQL